MAANPDPTGGRAAPPARTGRAILEIACGNGEFARRMAADLGGKVLGPTSAKACSSELVRTAATWSTGWWMPPRKRSSSRSG